MAALCVYCGSSPGRDPAFTAAAEEAGSWLASRGHTLVYGGGNNGLMGRMADAALACGGTVIGVIPGHLAEREFAHTGLTRLHTVSTMHERKATMAALADAFLALPGGIGTLEELIEIFVWNQLSLHAKPCGVLDVNGYYRPLRAMLRHMAAAKFLDPRHAAKLRFGSKASRLLPKLLKRSS
jgi:uncharacterized protein (TIGR00730 family)